MENKGTLNELVTRTLVWRASKTYTLFTQGNDPNTWSLTDLGRIQNGSVLSDEAEELMFVWCPIQDIWLLSDPIALKLKMCCPSPTGDNTLDREAHQWYQQSSDTISWLIPSTNIIYSALMTTGQCMFCILCKQGIHTHTHTHTVTVRITYINTHTHTHTTTLCVTHTHTHTHTNYNSVQNIQAHTCNSSAQHRQSHTHCTKHTHTFTVPKSPHKCKQYSKHIC